jgi:hypothetical protein
MRVRLREVVAVVVDDDAVRAGDFADEEAVGAGEGVVFFDAHFRDLGLRASGSEDRGGVKKAGFVEVESWFSVLWLC